MSDRPWYEQLFEDIYLRAWVPYFAPERTALRVEGIDSLLRLSSGSHILDLACGQGRIAIPLAGRGYQVTGLDLSQPLLAVAEESARKAKVQVRWIRSDMRRIPFEGEFDAVINIFTSFGYLESEEEDLKVLRGVERALKPGGVFLLDFINRDWVMRHFREHIIDRLASGAIVLHEASFDFLTSRNNVRVSLIEPDGRWQESRHSVRMYTLTELVEMLQATQLAVESYHGGLDGSEFGLESRRTVILSRKGK
jgi:SAM-dependent methyltransferase